MTYLKERITPIQNIAYISMMCAINVVITLLGVYVPFISIFIIIFLPLTSTIVSIFCKKSYYPIYALVTFGLCLLSGMADFQFVIFYVAPSIITGFIFGYSYKLRIPSFFVIIVNSFIQTGLTYLSLPIINALYEVNIIETMLTLLNLQTKESIYDIVPSFIFLLSVGQILLSFIIVDDVASQLNKKEVNENNLVILLSSWISITLSLLLLVLSISTAYIFMFVSMIHVIYLLVHYGFNQQYKRLIATTVCIFIASMIYLMTLSFIPEQYTFFYLILVPFCTIILETIMQVLNRKSVQKPNKNAKNSDINI